MRLEIRYPDRPPHEVELSGAMAVLGRDPSCDLVIGDERCSRRHAVLELTPTGLQVRDAGSANGVYVNGKKTERAFLTPGDLLRLGDVILKVLAEDMPGTVIVSDGEIADLGPPPNNPLPPSGPSVLGTDDRRPIDPGASSGLRAKRPPSGPLGRSRPAGEASRPASRPLPEARPSSASPPSVSLNRQTLTGGSGTGRPLTVTLLASLWLVSVLVYLAQGGLALTLGLPGGQTIGAVAGSVVLAALSGVMAFGLFGLKSWARPTQAVIAGIGLLVCPFTLASATTLIYVLRPQTRAAFEPGARPAADPAEMTFALTLVGTVVLGAALCVAGLFAARWMR